MSNFNTFLSKSDKLRSGYMKSLNIKDEAFKDKWLKHFSNIPSFFYEIYSTCNGTNEDIHDQVFFDFIPGYRLMTIQDIFCYYESIFKKNMEYDTVIPSLADYSGSYYAYAIEKEKECIVLYADGEFELVHSKISDFWCTIIAFYDEGVYCLDEGGYLSYDYEKEGLVGRKYNLGVKYWLQ